MYQTRTINALQVKALAAGYDEFVGLNTPYPTYAAYDTVGTVRIRKGEIGWEDCLLQSGTSRTQRAAIG